MGRKNQHFKRALSAQQETAKADLVRAYGEYWHSTNFQRGWATPAFLLQDVKAQLEDAADIVVRIRAYCQSKHADVVFSPITGSALDWLWTVHTAPADDHARTAFVDDLVHATFTLGGNAEREGGSMYMAPLDEHLVNKFIAGIRAHRAAQSAAPLSGKAQLRAEWEALSLLLDESYEVLLNDEAARNEYLERVRGLNKYLEELSKRAAEQQQQRQHEAAAAAAVAAALPSEAGAVPADAEHATAEVNTEADADAAAASGGGAAAQSEDDDSDESSGSSSGADGERARMKASIDRSKDDSNKTIIQIERIASDAQAVIDHSVHDLEADPTLSSGANLADLPPAEARLRVEKLQKRALEAAWKLENALNALDQLNNVTDDVRPLRKQNVVKIQGALRHIDTITSKLREMHKSVVADHADKESAAATTSTPANGGAVEAPREPDLKRSKEEQQSSAAPAAAKPSPVAEHVAPQRANSTDELLLKRFAKLKLDPRFDVQETMEGFSISAYCPNLGDTLKATLNDEQDVLTIAGTRLPTLDELAAMRQRIRVMMKQNALSRMYAHPEASEDELILRTFGGQFGTIEQKYRVPTGVDVGRASAAYQKNTIQVLLPHAVRPARGVPRARGPAPRGYGYW